MATFNGTPALFISSVLGGVSALSSSSVGASTTTYAPLDSNSPLQAINVGVGNSLTLDYWDLIGPLLSTSQASHPKQVWYAINKATGGIQTPALATEFMAAVHRFYNPGRINLINFCELTNHIGAGATFTAARDAAISYCSTARGLGWKVAFHIPSPRAQKSDPGYSESFSAWAPGQLATYNQAVDYFRIHSEHYDFVVDLLAVPELSDPFNATYYLDDGCHNTAAGITAKANAVAAANALFTF